MTDIVLCCGVGGVGKTTTAAALAVGHALAGRRVVVLTIDPARRLADALGIQALGNDPTPVTVPGTSGGPGRGGSLDALMLDRKAEFDAVIRRFAGSPDQAARLLDNRYYRAVSERLGGSHEYMAMEKLYDLVHDGRWDVVVVDTPPAQNALDFLQAPDRIGKVFDHSVLGPLLKPGRGLFAATTRQVGKLVARLVGDNVLEDIAEFFSLVGGMSSGFRDRSAAVHALLRSPRTAFFLVASAAAPARTDALAFLRTLDAGGMRFSGFIVNRVIDDAGVDPDALVAPIGTDPAAWATAEPVLRAVATRRREVARRHAAAIAGLLRARPGARVWRVPERSGGIASIDDLAGISLHLPPNPPA